jgi:hypothetical protein
MMTFTPSVLRLRKPSSVAVRPEHELIYLVEVLDSGYGGGWFGCPDSQPKEGNQAKVAGLQLARPVRRDVIFRPASEVRWPSCGGVVES